MNFKIIALFLGGIIISTNLQAASNNEPTDHLKTLRQAHILNNVFDDYSLGGTAHHSNEFEKEKEKEK